MGTRYKLLGRTGLRVLELCLGAMIFGDRRGAWGASKDEAARIVGELIAPERERWVLSTKYTLTMRPDDPNDGGAHRKSLAQSPQASLRRLGTDYIDLYWMHTWDAFTPVEEVVLQVPYSLAERSVERDLLPMAQVLELTVTAWSPPSAAPAPPSCDRLGARAAGTRRDRADPRRPTP